MQLVFGHDEVLCAWAAQRIKDMPAGFEATARAIGVMDDVLIAAVIYHDYHQKHGTCQISVAADSPKWAQRGIIRALLSVPFEQYGVQKLWSVMAQSNKRAIRFNLGIGFKQEAVLRHQFGRGNHAVMTSILDKEYRKLYC